MANYFRWSTILAEAAADFDIPAGDPQSISLIRHMADKEPL